jgi:diguanylate cyclase (GGDEF)-like protein/PAS domain S-box-containing protein
MSHKTYTDNPLPYSDLPDYIQTVVNHIEDPTIVIDTNYHVIFTNQNHVARNFNNASDKAFHFCHEIIHNRSKPCSGKSRPCPLNEVIKTKQPVMVTHTHFDSLFNKMFVEITATPILNREGDVIHIIETYKNVTRENKIKTALHESEMRYRSLFEQSGDAIFVLNAEGPQIGKILSANKAACHMYGYTEGELLRLSMTDLDTPEHAAKAPKRIKEILEGETLRLEIAHRRKDGSIFPVEVSASRMQIEGKKFVMAAYHDISKRKEAEEDRDILMRELQHISQTDGLTDLFNRQHLDKRLAEEMDRARRYDSPLSLIIFDIDYFKKINDTYGHITGDKILQRTASIIRETLRSTDIAGRFGGDEFVLVLVQTDIRVGMQVAERLRTRIEQEQISVNEHQSTGFSVSLGISQFNDTLTKTEEFIAKADTALYEAKRSSRNVVCRTDDSRVSGPFTTSQKIYSPGQTTSEHDDMHKKSD